MEMGFHGSTAAELHNESASDKNLFVSTLWNVCLIE